jgi:hypothetical protein
MCKTLTRAALAPVAKVWTGPDGTVWTVVLQNVMGITELFRLYLRSHPSSPTPWAACGAEFGEHRFRALHPELQACLGRELPPVEKPVFEGINAFGDRRLYQKRGGEVCWSDPGGPWLLVNTERLASFTDSELEAVLAARRS